MGLFQRRLKPETDLTNVPTDRLLREYQKLAGSGAYLHYVNQQTEFASKDDPVVVDADSMLADVNGVIVRGKVAEELKRRGLDVA